MGLWSADPWTHQDNSATMSDGVKLTDAQTSAAKDAFSSLDKRSEDKIRVGDIAAAMKKKGEVNVSELRWILKNLGDDLTEDDIDDMIADVDTDGSGWVDFDEFSKLMMG